MNKTYTSEKTNKIYSLVPGTNGENVRLEGDGGTVSEAKWHITEDDNAVILFSVDANVKFCEEYGTEYPEVTFSAPKERMKYLKNEQKFDIEEDFFDVESKDARRVCQNVVFGEFISRAIYHQSKYLYMIYCTEFHWCSWNGWSMPLGIARNTVKFINSGVFCQLEGLIKNLGIEFFKNNIERGDFMLNNSKKLHRMMELPKQVLDFLKDENMSGMLPTMQKIGADDPNDAVAVVDWHKRYSQLRNIRKGVKDYQQFMRLLEEIKSKDSSVTMNRLIPYLAMQRFYYCPNPDCKFEVPIEEARLYRDTQRMGLSERYPNCLQVAHNVAERNIAICKDESLIAKFEEVVKPLKDLEWENGDYVIVAPKTAQDLVDEGSALHHCVASYVELVANGDEKVMFLRKKDTPNESLVTFSFDNDFNIVEAKGVFNSEVEDPDMLDVLLKWRRKHRT